MAKRKKIKGGTRTKRKKAAKATRRKTAKARKTAKKIPARGRSPKKTRSTVAASARPATAAKPKAPTLPGQRIGVVTHYFSHLSVAILQLEPGATLRVGDIIHILGHTTDFKQKVESLEIDHAPVTEVGRKDDFGLKVIDPAREHDVVYKIQS